MDMSMHMLQILVFQLYSLIDFVCFYYYYY